MMKCGGAVLSHEIMSSSYVYLYRNYKDSVREVLQCQTDDNSIIYKNPRALHVNKNVMRSSTCWRSEELFSHLHVRIKYSSFYKLLFTTTSYIQTSVAYNQGSLGTPLHFSKRGNYFPLFYKKNRKKKKLNS